MNTSASSEKVLEKEAGNRTGASAMVQAGAWVEPMLTADGGSHTCSLTDKGKVICWGFDRPSEEPFDQKNPQPGQGLVSGVPQNGPFHVRDWKKMKRGYPRDE